MPRSGEFDQQRLPLWATWPKVILLPSFQGYNCIPFFFFFFLFFSLLFSLFFVFLFLIPYVFSSFSQPISSIYPIPHRSTPPCGRKKVCGLPQTLWGWFKRLKRLAEPIFVEKYKLCYKNGC